MRRAIANQMVVSHLHSVRTLHVDEADVSELVRLRERLKPRAESRGVRLSYLPLIMKAVGQVLPSFPSLSSGLDEVTQEVVLRDYVNLGMAVSTDVGLVVPVCATSTARRSSTWPRNSRASRPRLGTPSSRPTTCAALLLDHQHR